jgi:hypothetical protein
MDGAIDARPPRRKVMERVERLASAFETAFR